MSIGVFDSGIGGLSVLRALRTLMPEQDYVYFADSAYAPYGERNESYVLARSQFCIQALLNEGCSLIVIACNTATALAAKKLRQIHPTLPLVGIEPAIKPAAALTKNGHIGVLATQATLASPKFLNLLASIQAVHPRLHFHTYAPDGLALAIELRDHSQIEAIADLACQAMRRGAAKPYSQSASAPSCDTVVLGCTHYPLITALLQAKLGSDCQLIDPAHAVALHSKSLLPEAMQRRTSNSVGNGQLVVRSSASTTDVHAALAWMQSVQ